MPKSYYSTEEMINNVSKALHLKLKNAESMSESELIQAESEIAKYVDFEEHPDYAQLVPKLRDTGEFILPRNNTKKKKPVTPKNMEKLAAAIMDYLKRKDLWYHVSIYVNKKEWSSENNKGTKKATKSGTLYYEVEKDVTKSVEYCNEKTVTITFVGPLYDALNLCENDTVRDELNRILSEYGLYLEQGFAWSLAAYKM